MQLLPFQKQILNEIKNKKFKAVVALSMRMGKTVITCELLRQLKEKKPDYKALIIIPPILTNTWVKHLNEVTNEKNIFVMESSNNTVNYDANVFIVSYHILHNTWFYFPKVDCLILDESHFIKNWKAKRTRAIFKYLENHNWEIPVRILLTGTPILNKPIDLFPQIKIVNPNKFRSFWKFVIKYCQIVEKVGKNGRYREFITTANGIKKLHEDTKDNIIRYTWQDLKNAGYEIPKLIKKPILIGKASNQIQKLETKLKNEFDSLKKQNTLQAIRRECAILKIPKLIELTEISLENYNKLLIFVWHRDIAKLIAKELAKKNIKHDILLGGDNKKEKKLNDFKNGKFDVLICNLAVVGFGLKLDFCKVCMFAELDYSPSNISQAMYRIYGMDNQEPSIAIFPYLDGCYEKIIVDILVSKQKLHDKLVKIDQIDKLQF